MSRYVVGLGNGTSILAAELAPRLNEFLAGRFLIVSIQELGDISHQVTPEALVQALWGWYPISEWYVGVQGQSVPSVGSAGISTEHTEVAYCFQRSLGNKRRELLEPDAMYLTFKNSPELVEDIGDGMRQILLPNGNKQLLLPGFKEPTHPRTALEQLVSLVKNLSSFGQAG